MRGAVVGSRSGPGVVRGRLRRAGSCLPGPRLPACPACVPRSVRLHIPGLCRCARLGLRRPAGPGPCQRACRGLRRLVCRPARPRLVWRLACARLVGRSARRPVPACLYVPACRGFTCWGLCRLVCRGLHARLVGRLLAASGCRCGGPGCGPARGSACAAVAAFVPGLWAGCGGLRRPCGPCACRVVCVPCLCAWLCVWLRACPPRGVGFRGGLCAGFRVGLWGRPCAPAVCAPACGPACAPGCGPARWSASAVACGGFRAGLCARLRVGLGAVCAAASAGACAPGACGCGWVWVSGFRRCVCGC